MKCLPVITATVCFFTRKCIIYLFLKEKKKKFDPLLELLDQHYRKFI